MAGNTRSQCAFVSASGTGSLVTDGVEARSTRAARIMNDDELKQAEQIARKYGAANCWTGTSGHLAGWILRLLVEVKKLKEEQRGNNTDTA